MKHGAKNHSNTRKILNSNNVHTHTHAAGPLLYHALLSVLQKCSQPVIGDEQKREKPLLSVIVVVKQLQSLTTFLPKV